MLSFIKEVGFEVDLRGSEGYGSVRINWEMRKLGPVSGIALRLGSWAVGS